MDWVGDKNTVEKNNSSNNKSQQLVSNFKLITCHSLRKHACMSACFVRTRQTDGHRAGAAGQGCVVHRCCWRSALYSEGCGSLQTPHRAALRGGVCGASVMADLVMMHACAPITHDACMCMCTHHPRCMHVHVHPSPTMHACAPITHDACMCTHHP